MSDIYRQHDAAFASVSAYVLTDATGDKVGTVALKFPRDGAGRLFAYVHVIGLPMVRAFASGCGYDKRSAAVASAFGKIRAGEPLESKSAAVYNAECDTRAATWRALAPSLDTGHDWTRGLEDAGYRVLQAV